MSGDTEPAPVVGRLLLHRLDEDFVAWPWRLETNCLAPGIPPRPMSPSGLRRWLLAGATDYPTRDRTWARIVIRSRPPDEQASAFRLLAVGLAGYGLRNYARRIQVRSNQDLPDLHADLVTGFLIRLATIDPQSRNLAGRLIDSAIGYAARRYRTHPTRPLPAAVLSTRPEDAAVGAVGADRVVPDMAGPLQAGHRDGPCVSADRADRGCHDDGDDGHGDDSDREGLDQVLRRAAARAVHAGSPASARDVELIAATRLDRRPLPEVAALLGIGVEAAYKRRRRAEQRLTAALRRTP